jgi:hypothetical protein
LNGLGKHQLVPIAKTFALDRTVQRYGCNFSLGGGCRQWWLVPNCGRHRRQVRSGTEASPIISNWMADDRMEKQERLRKPPYARSLVWHSLLQRCKALYSDPYPHHGGQQRQASRPRCYHCCEDDESGRSSVFAFWLLVVRDQTPSLSLRLVTVPMTASTPQRLYDDGPIHARHQLATCKRK